MQDFKKSCIYQIYPKSFNDSDHDGLGDIMGITKKLDYLKLLGIDYIWSTPFFTSPQNDNGYDVADYRNIDPIYGTMEQLENLIHEAQKRELGLMLDMVFNHTSTEHEWFKKAMAGDLYYKDFYIFKDGKPDGSAPTNWQSKFGGSAWEYIPVYNQYYLHLFDQTQADLNWENPNVRKELKEILKFWIEKGIKGFRFDVINLISKPEIYEDDLEGDGRRLYTDGHKIHEYLKEINQDCGLYDNGMLTVGEMSSTTLEHCLRYSNPKEKELSMCFNFHHLKVDYKNQQKWELQDCDFKNLKDILNHWQIGMEKGDGWNAVFWCNHDQPRIVSRFGDDKNYHQESAKMLATMIHFLRGTPYVFQGEEIGMTNAYFEQIDQYRDVESLNIYHILKKQGKSERDILHILNERSRDNSRTPMQWNDSINAGFTQGNPWIGTTLNYLEINVEKNLQEANSIFFYYQRLIQLRKELDCIAYGSYNPLFDEHKAVFAYQRCYKDESLIVVNNFYGEETFVEFDEVPDGYHYLIGNYEERSIEQSIILKPYETLVFVKR